MNTPATFEYIMLGRIYGGGRGRRFITELKTQERQPDEVRLLVV
jgi:hypothetical protein